MRPSPSKIAIEMLKQHEGFRSLPYQCTAGVWTIGYGTTRNPYTGERITNLSEPIDEETAEDWLRYEIFERTLPRTLDMLTREEIFYFGPDRLWALVNMHYNLGMSGLKGFKKMWEALEKHNYREAGREALNSKWAEQVGYRAGDICFCLEHGYWASRHKKNA